MKKINFPLLALSLFFVLACKNGGKKPVKDNEAKSGVDSLIKIIDQGHHAGMGKIGRLHKARNAAQLALDSLNSLPAAAQQAARGYMDQLNVAIRDINAADSLMNKWMFEYKEDSAIDKPDQRMIYLEGERQKVDALLAAINNGIQKADSLLKK